MEERVGLNSTNGEGQQTKHILVAVSMAMTMLPIVLLAQEKPANCQPMSVPDRCLGPGGQVYRQYTSRSGAPMWFPATHRYEDCITQGMQLGYTRPAATDFCDKKRARGDVN